MLHVIYGENENSVSYEIHKLLKSLVNANIIHLYFDNNHQEILDSILQTNLFFNNQTFIIHAASFLQNEDSASLSLTDKISQINQEIYCFLLTKKTKFNEFVKSATLKKITKFNNAHKLTLIKTVLAQNNFRFEDNSIQTLFENIIDDNPFLVETELDKLMLLSENKIITKKMVEQVINDSAEFNIFKLVNYLITGNKIALLQLYERLILLKYQPVELIQIMSTQLFNLKMLKLGLESKYSDYEIESKLKISKFVLFTNKKMIKDLTIEQINQIMNSLALLDYNIKSHNVNPYLGLKSMLIK
ncbi:MAG: DNA polymerase III subunit delta [Mycoplasmataceae bacterium]|jgi:DNA polymerase-3 subunit delta|nr:DNA polymerase III subunit delta [Mycoplasmataceae bacterium]